MVSALTMPSNCTTFISHAPRLTRLLRSRSASSRTFVCSATPPPAPSISTLADAHRSGKVSVSDTVDASLRRINAINPTVNALLTVDAELLQSQAAALDRRLAAGEDPGPLAGVPIAIKDNLCTNGMATTGGSRILDNFSPTYDATAVSRLVAAGALVLGKANLDEFGMGSSTEFSAYGPTLNPIDLSRVPGGSSGGSAAAVAAGFCLGALGSDTGGSVRLPASFCGVTGIRPSYGRVSRHGLLAYASSFDTIGPITTSVADAALLLRVISGADDYDSTSVHTEAPKFSPSSVPVDAPLSGVRIGVVREALGDGVEPEIAALVRAAIDQLVALGADAVEVSLSRLDAGVAAYYTLALSEASANLARYDGVRYGMRDTEAMSSALMYAKSRADGFGVEVKRRIMAGTYTLSTGYYDDYYVRAQRIRTLVMRELSETFKAGVDVLVMPVSPTPAYLLGEVEDNPLKMYLDDILSVPSSLAGLPSLSLPCGTTNSSLPVGMQVVAPYLDEDKALLVGHAYQQATTHHLETPKLVDASLAAMA